MIAAEPHSATAEPPATVRSHFTGGGVTALFRLPRFVSWRARLPVATLGWTMEGGASLFICMSPDKEGRVQMNPARISRQQSTL
jgi:hypothetical protein